MAKLNRKTANEDIFINLKVCGREVSLPIVQKQLNHCLLACRQQKKVKMALEVAK